MREFAASVNSYTQHPSFQPALDIVAGGPVNMPADAPEWAQQAGMAVNHLLREVGALRAELRAAQLKIKYLWVFLPRRSSRLSTDAPSDACSIVRAQNSRALRAEHELERLPTLPALAAAPAKAEAPLPALGDAPASFPTTVGALRDLEDESFEGESLPGPERTDPRLGRARRAP